MMHGLVRALLSEFLWHCVRFIMFLLMEIFPVMDCLRKYICPSWFDFVACCAIIRGFVGFFVSHACMC
jgi:hypothetical protein